MGPGTSPSQTSNKSQPTSKTSKSDFLLTLLDDSESKFGKKKNRTETVESIDITSDSEVGSPLVTPRGVEHDEVVEEIRYEIVKLGDSTTSPRGKLILLNELIEASIDFEENISGKNVCEYVPGFLEALRPLLVSDISLLRLGAIRVLGCFSKSIKFVEHCESVYITFLLSRILDGLSLKGTFGGERLEVLRVVHVWLNLNAQIPRPLVQSLVAIVQQPQDVASKYCLEILCEVALKFPLLTSMCNGIRCILNAVLEKEYACCMEGLVVCILALCNDNMTRKYIRSDLDFQSILHPLTNLFDMDALKKNVTTATAAQQAAQQAQNHPNHPNHPNQQQQNPANAHAHANANRGQVPSQAINNQINQNQQQQLRIKIPEDCSSENWQGALTFIINCLHSWTGLYYLAHTGLGLDAIVNALNLPGQKVHLQIINGLFEIFHLAYPKSTDPFRLSLDIKKGENNPEKSNSGLLAGQNVGRNITGEQNIQSSLHNVFKNFLVVLLLAFVKAGLIDALVKVVFRTSEEEVNDIAFDSTSSPNRSKSINSRVIRGGHSLLTRVTVFLGELLFVSNNLLPASLCSRLQSLPFLVTEAATFSSDHHIRSRASTLVMNLHAYSYIKAAIGSNGGDGGMLDALSYRNQKKVEDIKDRLNWLTDEAHLAERIKETKVELTTDWQKWNWDEILELMEGPLNNPVLTASALGKTGFYRRILAFYRPSRRIFSKMTWNKRNMKYVRLCSQLLQNVTKTEVGFEFFKDNKMLTQVAEMLRLEVEMQLIGTCIVDESKGKPQSQVTDVSQRLFSAESVLKTMAREYFGILGSLCSTPYGQKILVNLNIFDYFMTMVDLPNRDDLSDLVMDCLDYSTSAQAQEILAKALLASSKVVRFVATRRMRTLLRSANISFSRWCVALLLKQLKDEDKRISLEAVSILGECCSIDTACIDAAINCLSKGVVDKSVSSSINSTQIIVNTKDLLSFGSKGNMILIKFLSRTNGYDFLSKTSYVEDEMKRWYDSENAAYAKKSDNDLQQALSSSRNDLSVMLPPHFYGELAATKKGCKKLKDSGHFDKFVKDFLDTSLPEMVRSGSLMAVGQIGSSPTGYVFLEESNTVSLLVELVETCSCLSLRGLAFTVLGMISHVAPAREALEKLNWLCLSGVAVPEDPFSNPFLTVNSDNFEGSWAERSESFKFEEFNDPRDQIKDLVMKLTNTIQSEAAFKNLKRLYDKQPSLFTCPELFFQVLTLMSHYSFRLDARRLVLHLFDTCNFGDFSSFRSNFISEDFIRKHKEIQMNQVRNSLRNVVID